MSAHKNLMAWRRSIDFVTQIYGMTAKFPAHELFGLCSQLRRAAVSIPSNISEGAARRNQNEFRQFLHIALGSLAEVETQMIISINLGYIQADEIKDLMGERDEIARLVQGLVRSINKKIRDQ